MRRVENPTMFINVDVIGDSTEMDTCVQVSFTCNYFLSICKYLYNIILNDDLIKNIHS